MSPVTVSDLDFSKVVLENDKPVLVDFWAEWCGPCKQVAPILQEISDEYDGLVIAKLNVDDNPVTAAAEGITSIPTLNVYHKGALVKQIIGARPKKHLLRELSEFIG